MDEDDLETYLAHAADALDEAHEFAREGSRPLPRMARLALERCFEIAGEALARVKALDPSLVDRLPGGRPAIGLRNVLSHEYDRILEEVLISAALDAGRVLADEIRRLLGSDRGRLGESSSDYLE